MIEPVGAITLVVVLVFLFIIGKALKSAMKEEGAEIDAIMDKCGEKEIDEQDSEKEAT